VDEGVADDVGEDGGRARPWALSDGAVAAVAGAAALGAWWAGGPGRLAGLAVVGLALVLRWAWLLAVGVLVVAGGLGAVALEGLAPATPGPVDGWATLTTDPEPLVGGGVRVLVRVEGRRYDAVAFGSAGAALARRLAGEEVEVVGRVRPLRSRSAWALSRRLVGRLSIEEVGGHRSGVVADAANALHRTLANGSQGLPAASRALLAGVVLGDDRAQLPEVVDDVRAAGLGHLTAVSGQNVAFVLVVAGPVLQRMRWARRLPATLLVLAAFAVVVRFEPSVLRAGVMAGIATTAAALGRPADGIRVLALAVAGLVLVDPLLVRSLGFGLSVSASAAILLLSPRLQARLPGPGWLAAPLAVTVAAQVGVTPLLLGRPDGLPAVAVAANLLAVPAAGPLMVWGLTAGVVAGVVPGLAGVLHLPTSLLAGWIVGVARLAAGLPLGTFGPAHAATIGGAAVLTWALRGRRAGGLAGAAALVAVLAGAVVPSSPPGGVLEVDPAASLWAAGGAAVLLVDGPVDVDATLAALRGAGARCVDAVVVARGGPAPAALAAALRRRCPATLVVAPPGEAHPGWDTLGAGDAVVLGDLRLTGDGRSIAVGRAPPPR
jgi:competence protein ComEC